MFKIKTYSVGILLVVAIGLSMEIVKAQRPNIPPNLAPKKNSNDTVLIGEVEKLDIGYMTIPKKFVTGSTATLVSDSRIKDLAVNSPNNLLQAQFAGVKSVSTSAVSALVSIRGTSSVNAGSQPLYIIDGIPVKASRFANSLATNVDNDPLSDLHPEDIASITVLKDAQATSIYGMRGGNGVVLITTNGGTAGKTYLDFTAYTGVMNQPDNIPVLDTAQYRSYILAKERASGVSNAGILSGVGRYLLLSTPASQVERYNNSTNWQDAVTRNGMLNNVHLTLRGGDAIAKYSLNIGYSKLKGVITNTDFSRFGLRFNLDYKVGRKLSFLNSLTYTKTDKTLSDAGNSPTTNQLFLTTLKAPTLNLFQQDLKGSNLVYVDSADYTRLNNPYAVGKTMVNTNSSNRISAKTIGQYTFSPNLVLRIGIALDYFRLNETRFVPAAGFATTGYIVRYSAAQNSSETMFLNENSLTYTKKTKSGVLTALVGTAVQSTSLDSRYGRAVNSPTDQVTTINTSDALLLDSIGSISAAWNLLSAYASVNYAIKEKFIFGGNFRADGSNRFQKQKRFGYFPSASFAWRLNKEDFLKNNKSISELKLRTSYGIAGNENVGTTNAFNSLVATPYIYSALSIGIIGNPNFQWESTKQFNAGADLELYKGKLALSVDFYHKKTDHLFNVINLPTVSGFNNYAVSEGSVQNSGIETSIAWKILDNPRKFSWQTSLNFSYNKNKIIALPARLDSAINYDDYTMALQTGVAMGSFFGYHAMGIYAKTTDVQVKNGASNLNPFKGGDVIFEDVNKDGIIDFHDKKVIGNVNPDFFGGFINTFSYKNLDLSVFVDFAVGGKIYNARQAALESVSNNYNQSTNVLRYWKNEGDQTDITRLQNGDPVGNNRFSSRWIEDGSYARFKSITLGYNLPLKTVFKKVFSNARILVTAQNLVTFSKYKGYSPEVANAANPLMYGVDYGNVPPLKSVIVGVQLGL